MKKRLLTTSNLQRHSYDLTGNIKFIGLKIYPQNLSPF